MTASALLLASILRPGLAEPRVPASDSEIVERLPRGLASISPRKVRTESSTVQASPATVARSYIKLAQKYGEPRYAHFAENMLRQIKEPSLDVRFLRGVIAQHLHRFGEAQAAFEDVLRADPNHADALLQLAMLHSVQGRFHIARELLARNTQLMGRPNGLGVLAVVASLSGQLNASYTLLEKKTAWFTDAPEQSAWLKSSLAEMAVRLGQFEPAERFLNEARMLQPGTVSLLIQWADLLLDQGRFAEAAALADHRPVHTGTLLRAAVALAHLPGQHEQLDRVRSDLQSRLFDASGPQHLREQALFTLHVLGRPREALVLALKNFESQREPVDARLVLESALRAQALDQAAPVRSWLEETKLEDAAIDKLLVQFGKPS